jgi:hypothetical protein
MLSWRIAFGSGRQSSFCVLKAVFFSPRRKTWPTREEHVKEEGEVGVIMGALISIESVAWATHIAWHICKCMYVCMCNLILYAFDASDKLGPDSLSDTCC